MTCRSIKKKLKPFIDGELSPEEGASIHDHLSMCTSCQKEFESIQAVWNLLETYPEALVPPGFAQRVVARAEDIGKRKVSVFSGLLRWQALPVGWTTVVVFFVGLFLGGQIFRSWSYRMNQTLTAYLTEEESYSLEAFQDFPPRSLLEGYWEMLPMEGSGDIQ